MECKEEVQAPVGVECLKRAGYCVLQKTQVISSYQERMWYGAILESAKLL